MTKLEKSPFLQLVIIKVAAFVDFREENEKVLGSSGPQFFGRFLFFNSWMGKLPNLYELQYVPLQNENNNTYIARGVKAGVYILFCEEPVNILGFVSYGISVATTQLYSLVQKQP